MTYKNLVESDIKFLAEARDEAVTMYESLFQDFDFHNLDNEESDDPDWATGDSFILHLDIIISSQESNFEHSIFIARSRSLGLRNSTKN